MSKELSGNWFTIQDEAQFNNLKAYGSVAAKRNGRDFFARVQRGEYTGPGKYMLLQYSQRCPRNCCDDAVNEVLSASDVQEYAKEQIIELAKILKEAKQEAKNDQETQACR